MIQFWMNVGWYVAGFATCIFVWPKLKLLVNGAETEAQALRDRAAAIMDKVK
jgi:hypothetical protein